MGKVTILILIDGFLQLMNTVIMNLQKISHNPYFNRWFSAIMNQEAQCKLIAVSQSLF